MLPDFNRLKVFYFIYLHQSVSDAAKQLYLTQSAVSQNLIKLEGELQVLLFTRLHKRLIPTLEGDNLFHVMKPFMLSLQDGLENIQRGKKEPYGQLRIGAPVEFGSRYIPHIVSQFREQHENVRFSLHLGHPKQLLDWLKEGVLDFTFADIFHRREVEERLSLFRFERIFREEMTLVCSSRYLQEQLKKREGLKTIEKAHFIAYQPHGDSVKSWFLHHYGKSPKVLRIVFTVESVKAVIEAVACHMGLALVPTHFVKQKLEQGLFHQIKTKKESQSHDIALVQLLDKVPTMTEKTFLEFANQFFVENSF